MAIIKPNIIIAPITDISRAISALNPWFLSFWDLAILNIEVTPTSQSYERYKSHIIINPMICQFWEFECLLFPLLLIGLSETRYKPIKSVMATDTIPITYNTHDSISPKTDERTTAVMKYLAISISHLPNSFLIGYEALDCKGRHYYCKRQICDGEVGVEC